MAKQPQIIGRSKIRLLFMDADLASGDIQELTNALTSAIRPTHLISRQIAPSRLIEASDPAAADQSDTSASETGFAVEQEEEIVDVPKGPSKPRKYRSPKVVNDLDMKAGGNSFSNFASEKGNPSETTTRYLIAAYWLAEFASLSTATVDHIYTCYKSAGWTFDVVDPGLPFRYFKRQGFGDTNAGQFTINHIGKGRVEKLGKGSEGA